VKTASKAEPYKNIIVSEMEIDILGRRRIGGRIFWTEKVVSNRLPIGVHRTSICGTAADMTQISNPQTHGFSSFISLSKFSRSV
jgi:hypothetical protein